jgi:tetrahydromethanopterin S-methyltransferase subunit G
MSPELIAIIAMFVTIGGMLFNQSKKFDKMNDKIDNTKTELTNKIDSVKDELTAFKIETTNNFAKVNDRLIKIESKLDIIDERYTTTNKKIDEYVVTSTQRTDKIETDIKEFKSEIKTDIKELKADNKNIISKAIDKMGTPTAATIL